MINFILNHWVVCFFVFIIISTAFKWFYENFLINMIDRFFEYLDQKFYGDKIIEINKKVELVNYEYYEKLIFEKEELVNKISNRLENEQFKLLLFNENELRKSSIHQKKNPKYKKKRKK